MKTILKLSLFSSILVLIAISCQKTLSYEDSIGTKPSKEFNAAFIKDWYNKSFIKSVEYTTNNIKENGKKQPDWKNGTYRKVGNMEIMEFTLLKQKKTIAVRSDNALTTADKRRIASASLKRISFIKTGNNEIIIRELDYIPDWEYLKAKKFDITDVKLGQSDNKFTGKIITKTWGGEVLSVRLLKEGKITGRVVTKQKKSTIKGSTLLTTPTTHEECEDVEYCNETEMCEMEWICLSDLCGYQYVVPDNCYWEEECWTEEECEMVEDEPGCDYGLSESCECQLYGIGCNGGGSGGGQSGASVNNVINQLTTPCLVNIFNQITETKLKNQITKLFDQTFIGNGDIVNFKIIEVTSLTGSNGLPQSAASWMLPTSTGIEWGVKLNSSFVNSSSKEYIGLSLIHEIVHSFVQLYTIRTGVILTDSASHTVMFETWVSQMRDALIDIFGLSNSDATALALQGMDDILADEDASGNAYYKPGLNQIAITKYGMDLTTARITSDQYEDKTKGTSCP